MFKCMTCNKEFKSSAALQGHQRMHGPSGGHNPKSEAAKQKIEDNKLERRRVYYLNPKMCKGCNIPIPYEIASYQLYCSKSCSTSHTNKGRVKSNETRVKISNTLKSHRTPLNCSSKPIIKKTKKKYNPPSKQNKIFTVRIGIKNIKTNSVRIAKHLTQVVIKNKLKDTTYPTSKVFYNTCSHCFALFTKRAAMRYCDDHSNLYKSQNRNRYAFTFNVYDYPELFDIDLIKEKGWHSHGGRYKYNPNGLTRDHKVSVNESIKNGYDPYYIKHPLNCEIMTFAANNVKKTSSSMSYEDLKKQVDEYDEQKNIPN